MNLNLNLTAVGVFIALVVPGLVSTAVYRLIMPARVLDWTQAAVAGLFYGSLNFAILYPLVRLASDNTFASIHPWWQWLIALIILLVCPALWPIVLRALFKWSWLAKRMQIPYPTAWDFFFDFRESVFVLVHLRNGSAIGGYWGGKSYAGSFPNDGDLYLEAVYRVDSTGRFGDPIPDTRGILLRRDEYSYLELFSVPKTE
jgi:hypothetical protein